MLGDGRTFAGEILSIFLTLNVLLCAFNLIPLPPLDGASVIGLFIPASATLKMRELSHSPMFQLAGLLIAWRIFPSIVESALRTDPSSGASVAGLFVTLACDRLAAPVQQEVRRSGGLC